MLNIRYDYLDAEELRTRRTDKLGKAADGHATCACDELEKSRSSFLIEGAYELPEPHNLED